MSTDGLEKVITLDGGIKVIVKSDGTVLNSKGLPRKPSKCYKGYLRLHIGNHHYFVHKLVALAFVPNPKNLPQVNHKDGNKENNDYRNLEWVTNSQNHIHSVLCNLWCNKVTKEQVSDIRRRYALGNITHDKLASEYGITFSMVGRIVRRTSWNYEEVDDN